MSLLIKALHKAEQGKVSDNKAAGTDLSLELTPKPEAGLAHSATSPQSASPSAQPKHISQQAASSMFAVKNAQANNAASKKSWLIAGACLLALALIGMQFYSYLNALKQPDLVLAKAPAISPVVPPALPAVNSSASSAPAVPETIAPPAVVTAHAVKNPPANPEKMDKDLPVAKVMGMDKVADHEQAPPRQATSAKSEQLAFGEPVAASEHTTVKVTRNNPAIGINPALLAAYQAFNANDDATAQRNYRQVLQSDVRNVDALLGMAAIAAREGRSNDALGWYGKVLEVEPKNSVAQAAMISVFSQTDPVGSESRIKSLLAQQPEAANLHAALGSLYAEQSQWSAAQQAYFQAHHFDPNNAEYAFNLAISLDQLGKSALALQYYKQALELFPKSGGNIDRAQLESRIAQLQ